MLASTCRTVLCQTLIAIMSQCALPNASASQDDDEVFSDVDFPINPGTGAEANPELAAFLDKIQALRTTGCG